MNEVSVSRPAWRARVVPLRLRSDARLARDAATGDTAAFAALYERHHQPLYRYCRSIVGDPDDAADALQSTMARALAAIGERDADAPVRAWLFRIAHNESISLLRRRRAAEPLDADALVGPDVEADAERRRRLADLVRDLQGLSERQRGALLMREVSGLGHAEIAAALGTSEGAVKQSIYEARAALQELAEGREMTCESVQQQLSDGDGRTARSRRLRGHLRSCEDCRRFREALRSRPSELALVAPVLPAGTAAAVLEAVIGAGGSGGGGLLAAVFGGGAGKAVAVGAATVTAGAGAVTYTAVAPDGGGVVPPDRVVRELSGGGGKRPGPARPALIVAPTSDEDAATKPAARRGSERTSPRAARDGTETDEDRRGSSGRGGGGDRGRSRRGRDDDEREERGEREERDDDSGRDEDEDEDEDSSGRGGREEESGTSAGYTNAKPAKTPEPAATPEPAETPEPDEEEDED